MPRHKRVRRTSTPKHPIGSPTDFILKGGRRPDLIDIGKLTLLERSAETDRCVEIQQVMDDYAKRPKVSRPLSIAVFGPPGSGKSTYAREIVGSIPECSAPFVLNLSQLPQSSDLAEAFTKKLLEGPEGGTRVFFFDEFDAALNNAPLGWLRWFLAPMQDGEFFFDGQTVQIGKAIFVFAGGTASTFEDFKSRALLDPGYVDKKVPDFISRLHGFMDIQGINDISEQGIIRRALVLRRRLESRWPGQVDKKGPLRIDKSLVDALLQDIHFVHGARSMEAFLSVCRLNDKKLGSVTPPSDEIKKLHLSRGKLDGKAIGISAGPLEPEMQPLLDRLAELLLRNGATLAYGGEFVPKGTLQAVTTAAAGIPERLIRWDAKRIRNYVAFPTELNTKVQQMQGAQYVSFLPLATMPALELSELGVPRNSWFPARPRNATEPYDPRRHMAWALSLFRMRVRLVHDIDALVVVGGKDDGRSWGRFSGIAEEVMLALALGKPIYVLGGPGGAARAVGRLLGLAEAIANRKTCLVHDDDPAFLRLLPKYDHCFSIAGRAALPLCIDELRQFIANHSVTTAAWPWNGLKPDENRELFKRSIRGLGAKHAVDVVVQALLKLDWKASSEHRVQGQA